VQRADLEQASFDSRSQNEDPPDRIDGSGSQGKGQTGMSVKCGIQLMHIVDYAMDQLEGADWANVRSHIDAGCELCLERLRSVQGTVADVEEEAATEQLLAQPLLDTQTLQPRMAGVRGSATLSRRRVYEAESRICIDLQQHEEQPGYSTLDGQVLVRGGDLREVAQSMVYGVVRRAEGQIRVESQPDEGATFEICLPAKAVLSNESGLGAEESGPPRGVEGVLIVEDEPAVRQLTADVLSGQGYSVMEAVTGHEALRIAQQNGPDRIDLVLTDVVMPHVSGRELADKLHELYPGIKVLFMSGYPDDMTIAHGVSGKSIPFPAKPFTPAVVARKVRETLDAA